MRSECESLGASDGSTTRGAGSVGLQADDFTAVGGGIMGGIPGGRNGLVIGGAITTLGRLATAASIVPLPLLVPFGSPPTLERMGGGPLPLDLPFALSAFPLATAC